MKVGELIEELQKVDKNMEVALYVQEDMNWLRKVRIETKDGQKSYCKADHVLTFGKYKGSDASHNPIWEPIQIALILSD